MEFFNGGLCNPFLTLNDQTTDFQVQTGLQNVLVVSITLKLGCLERFSKLNTVDDLPVCYDIHIA